jgi:hypothetical protein
MVKPSSEVAIGDQRPVADGPVGGAAAAANGDPFHVSNQILQPTKAILAMSEAWSPTGSPNRTASDRPTGMFYSSGSSQALRRSQPERT